MDSQELVLLPARKRGSDWSQHSPARGAAWNLHCQPGAYFVLVESRLVPANAQMSSLNPCSAFEWFQRGGVKGRGGKKLVGSAKRAPIRSLQNNCMWNPQSREKVLVVDWSRHSGIELEFNEERDRNIFGGPSSLV